MSAAVVECNTTPVFELGKQVFDFVSGFVRGLAVFDCFFSIFFGGIQDAIFCSASISRILLLS